jgi:RND family efflux transporter MFP subunit
MNRTAVLVGVFGLLVGLGLGYFMSGQIEGTTTAESGKAEVLFYRNPMNPDITSPVPAKDSMGMDYVPVFDESGGGSEVVGTVKIDPTVQFNIGMRTAIAERRAISRTIRTVGRVDYDEEKMFRLHPKVEGWIKEIMVDKTGQLVRQDDILLGIYSPKLVSTQQEYLLALKNQKALKDSKFEDIRAGAESLVASSRQRLSLLDVPEHQIAELETTGTIKQSLHIHAPAGGTVMRIGARQGQFVTPATELYRIVDLSTVWVYADVYEYELPWVKEGDPVEMTLASVPGVTFRGELSYIYPYAESKTRTTKVRLIFDNSDSLLRPEMFSEITIHSQQKLNQVVVPAEAVVRSGAYNQMFVIKEPGVIEPRKVTLGVESSGFVAVTDGVSAGELVVVSSQFMIDSESKLREATAKMLNMGAPGMIEFIINASLKDRLMVLIATAIIAVAGYFSYTNAPLDAIPDLSDVQVIVLTEYSGQSPQVVEDQVTYPLTTAMLAVPDTKVVRGYSFFGLSFVYIIFEDGTDMYWARSRVLESINYVSGRLPDGVTPTLGPDATGVGWIYEYALVDRTGQHDLAKLRSIQDWYLRYPLQTVAGVSEVASVGGFVKQYQIEVDPNALLRYNIPLGKVKQALKDSNRDVGGRLIEMAETEYMVRGRGYIQSIEDINTIPVAVDSSGTPVRMRDIAHVQIGPELRRGLVDLNGEGEVAGGVVIMRFGENALATIEGVRQKLEELKTGLPDGVEIVPVYDRGDLIERAVKSLNTSLMQQLVIVSLVVVLFLLHARSAFVAIITLPLGILMAFIVMRFQGLNANIMSLGGIAITIGTPLRKRVTPLAMMSVGTLWVFPAGKSVRRYSFPCS